MSASPPASLLTSPGTSVMRQGRVMRGPVRPPGELTRRHLLIIELVSHGRTNAQISEQIGTCQRIVKMEITHACEVLAARNRAHLAATALRRGFVR